MNVLKDADYTNYVEMCRPLWHCIFCADVLMKIWRILVLKMVNCVKWSRLYKLYTDA